MPKKLHEALAAEARKKGLTGEDYRRYVYGGMVNAGWKPKGRGKGK